MKKWPRLRDIFSLHPTVEPGSPVAPSVSSQEDHWQKTKFDNAIRAWIAVPSYLACSVLWLQGAIPSLIPMSLVFGAYGTLQFLISWYFMESRHGRKLDFLFSSLDLVAMSLSIYFTGGTNSPLYFIYFIPLVVHAFHRDMGVVVYSGFGGVVLYALAIWKSLGEVTPAVMTNLGARLFFMLLTVSIACLALGILRKQDAVDRKRILRLKNLTLASDALNHLTSLSERPATATVLIQLIKEGLGTSFTGWARFLFVQKDGTLMRALADPADDRAEYKQEIPTLSCPVMKNNSAFSLEDARSGMECPTEKFPFGSHICLPISGAENESFGVLFVGSAEPNAFKKEEMQFLEFIAKSFGLSIQRLNRMEELRKSLEMNSWVMAATIASSRSTADTYGAVLDGVMTILQADMAELFINRPDAGKLTGVLSRGGAVSADRALTLQLKTIKGDELGLIRAARRNAVEKFSAIEVEAATTFAMRAALAIENALSHEHQREQIQSSMAQSERKQAA